MRLRELPTGLLRSLASRCEGYDAAAGDRRVALRAVSAACYAEIDARLAGRNFPEISEEAAAALRVSITESSPQDFARLVFEIDE